MNDIRVYIIYYVEPIAICQENHLLLLLSDVGAQQEEESAQFAGELPTARTRKAIDTLPSHAHKIYSKAHKTALKQYASPSKRRGGKGQSKEQVAHRVAWSAVKKEYKKKGDKWVPKKD